MGITWRWVASFCIFVIVAFTVAGAAVDGYSISGSSDVEIPTQTVSYEGQEYTIDSISRITASESVTLTTSVPSGASYNIYLRDPDNQIVSKERKTGDATHELSYFGSGEAGTYVATIEDDGDTVAVYPIVIAGFDVSMPSPDDVTKGEEVTVQATVSERSVEKHSSLDRVEVVIGNDDVEIQKSMTQVDENTYEATVTTDNLVPKTYNVYTVVRGDETVRQRAEILGISDTVELTVTSTETPTRTSEDSPDDGTDGNDGTDDGTDGNNGTDGTDGNDETDGGADGNDGTDDGTDGNDGTDGTDGNDETDGGAHGDDQTPTVSPEPTPPETITSTTLQPPESTTATDRDSDGGSLTTPGGETTTNSETGNVIAPATSTGSPTSSGSGPGFTIAMALFCILTTIAIGRYR